MSTADFLKKLPFAVNSEAADGMECTVQLSISEPSYLVVANGLVQVHAGEADAPDVTLTVSDDNLIKLLKGELSGVMAYMSGKLQVDGDLMLAKQLPEFFDSKKLA
jgi:putative sterol carrier protein